MISSRDAENHYRQLEHDILKDVSVLNSYISTHGKNMEGNCFYSHHQTDLSVMPRMLMHKRINFVNLLRQRYVKKMIEVGFNAGHSAAIFLHALPKDSIFLSFDLCEHPYTKECFEYLKSKHPQMQRMIEGDSTKTVFQFINENPSELGTYDVFHVDGGHSQEVCISDLNAAHLLLKPGGVLILDDTFIPEIAALVPQIEDLGYRMLFQIPTLEYSHILFEKPF
jgi:predicted O-methyltransferase YrrM